MKEIKNNEISGNRKKEAISPPKKDITKKNQFKKKTLRPSVNEI